MKKWIVSSLAILLTACVIQVPPTQPPTAPPALPVAGVGTTLTSPLAGVHVVYGDTQCDTDERGVAWCYPVTQGEYVLKVTLPEGYIEDEGRLVDVSPQGCSTWPNCEFTIPVMRIVPPTPPVGAGRVVANGPRFFLNGQPWQWRGATDFMLFRDYLDGKDLSAVLLDRVSSGATLVRVLGMAHYIPVNAGQAEFSVSHYPNYFDRLPQFVAYVASFGLRVEFTAIADGQILMVAASDQREFIRHVSLVLPDTAFLELCNEPFKNGCDVADLKNYVRGEVIYATGNYDWDNTIVGMYLTQHEARDEEWPRKTRLDEWSGHLHVAAVSDEPMGAAETDQPGRRSSNYNDFFDFCAGNAMHGAGMTFHSENGLLSQLWQPTQKSLATMCFDTMKLIPADAPIWHYTRGGLGDNAIAHDDALALRTFCQLGGNQAVCEAVRPAATWTAVAINGWHIVSQSGPNGRLVFLAR